MEQERAKQTFVAGLFYTFLVLSSIAFLFHLFGLDWFTAKVTIKDPSYWTQQVILAGLKAFELLFIYKMLLHKSFLLCALISVIQTVAVGFLPVNYIQGIADAVIMLTLALIFRKDRGWAIVDFLFIYGLMCLYGVVFLVARFGGFSLSYAYSFYMNIVGMIDYKLFIVTLYLYTKYKGGIKIWNVKRRLLSMT